MRLPRLFPLLLCALLLFATACDTGDPGDGDNAFSSDQGLVTVSSDTSFDATAQRLLDSLNANSNITVVTDFDHADNAGNANMTLPPTRVVIFGNPALGTPLMQAAQTTGLDLPQKFLLYEDSTGVFAAYNTPAYLRARHGLPDSLNSTLDQIGEALRAFAEEAAGASVSGDFTAGAVSEGQGLVIDTSAFDFETTYDRLTAALEAAGPVSIVAEIDHAANAQSAGLDLNPTRLVLFGNPALGTPLMQEARSIGIDLPQKMLVYEDSAGVFTAYNDPFYLAERHGLSEDTEQLQPIADALANFAAQATTEGGDDGEGQ